MQKLQHFIKKIPFYVPWGILYLSIIGVAIVSTQAVLEQYTNNTIPSGSIGLSVEKTKFQLGEPVVFTVTNHLPTPVYVLNECPGEPLNVYRWTDNTWYQLSAQVTKEECYERERNVAIASEDTRTYNFDEWPELFSEPGVYRIAAIVDHYEGVLFQDFVVMEEPEVVIIEDVIVTPADSTLPEVNVSIPQNDPVVVTSPDEELLDILIDLYNSIPVEDEYEDEDD